MYLRCTFGKRNADLNSEEAQGAIRLTNDEGLRVIWTQLRIVGYGLIVADSTASIGSPSGSPRCLSSGVAVSALRLESTVARS